MPVRDMHNRIVAVKGVYLGDEVYFARDERWARSLEGDGLIIYTLAETEIVKVLDESTKRLVHEAKRQGAVVVDRETTSDGKDTERGKGGFLFV